MSKAIKFKNNTYLDSSSVVHNKVALNTILTPNYYVFEMYKPHREATLLQII